MEERLIRSWNRCERIQAYSVLLLFAGLTGGIAAGILWSSISLGGTVFVLGGIGCMLVRNVMGRKKKSLLDRYLGAFFCTELTSTLGDKTHTPEFAFSRNKLEQFSWKKGEWETCQVEETWESRYRGIPVSVANVRLWHSYRVNARETNQKLVFEGVCILAEIKNSNVSDWSARLREAGMPPAFLGWNENQLFLAFDKTSEEAPQTPDSYIMQQKFAQVPENLSVKSMEDLKEAFRRSLQPVLRILDILTENQ